MSISTVLGRMNLLSSSLVNWVSAESMDVNDFIGMSEEQTDEIEFDKDYLQAVSLLALHLIQKTKDSKKNGSSSGPIKSKKERSLSISYQSSGSNSSIDPDLASTVWGQMRYALTIKTIVPNISY